MQKKKKKSVVSKTVKQVESFKLFCFVSDTLDRTLGEKRHVATVELTVSPWEASTPGTSSCHMTYDEEVEAQISADIKAAVDSGVQSAYLQGKYYVSTCFHAA